MKIKLDEGAFVPTKAHSTDAGFDLYAREDFEIPACAIRTEIDQYGAQHAYSNVGYATHDTGVHVELPANTVGMIKSKSGLNVKHGITGEGVIDVGYTGSIVVKLYNHSCKNYSVKKGDKISQLVIMPIIDISNKDLEIVDTLEETERGNGGFGSTGK